MRVVKHHLDYVDPLLGKKKPDWRDLECAIKSLPSCRNWEKKLASPLNWLCQLNNRRNKASNWKHGEDRDTHSMLIGWSICMQLVVSIDGNANYVTSTGWTWVSWSNVLMHNSIMVQTCIYITHMIYWRVNKHSKEFKTLE